MIFPSVVSSQLNKTMVVRDWHIKSKREKRRDWLGDLLELEGRGWRWKHNSNTICNRDRCCKNSWQGSRSLAARLPSLQSPLKHKCYNPHRISLVTITQTHTHIILVKKQSDIIIQSSALLQSLHPLILSLSHLFDQFDLFLSQFSCNLPPNFRPLLLITTQQSPKLFKYRNSIHRTFIT